MINTSQHPNEADAEYDTPYVLPLWLFPMMSNDFTRPIMPAMTEVTAEAK